MKIFRYLGYEITKNRIYYKNIPDVEFYQSTFMPWLGYGDFNSYFNKARKYTHNWEPSIYTLLTLAKQASSLEGVFVECGVWKGGTALVLAEVIKKISKKKCELHLFDTFTGLPDVDKVRDRLKKGKFNDTSLDAIKELLSQYQDIYFHPGYIPESFEEWDSVDIALAHIDVDLYKSVMDCCKFIYPKMIQGGFMIFDDYGVGSCPGARQAVDEFFSDKDECPLVLYSGQAIVVRSASYTR